MRSSARSFLALALVCALGQRPATVVRVIDGDSVSLDLDLGFGIHVEGDCRLSGVNSPEIGTAPGAAARAWMLSRLTPGESVCFIGQRREKYGRPLVTIFDAGGNVNDALVAAGQAVKIP